MSRNRFIRMVALAGCSVLIGAFGYTPSASGHVGASHAPFNTDIPDLLSASIVGGTTVRACFDVSIDTINNDSRFTTWSYDSFDEHVFNNWAGSIINPDNDKCVDLDGSDHPSLDQARSLGVGGYAVEDANGNENSTGAVALTGGVAASEMHETDAPELLTATRVGTTERARFGFDELVDDDGGATTPQVDEFGFVDNTGEEELGDTIIAVDDNEVEVEFDGSPSLAAARLFFVDTEFSCRGGDPAVHDMGVSDDGGAINDGAKYNVLDTIATGSPAGRTDDPDLTGVAVADGNRLNYTYDERIDPTDVEQSCFQAYESDGDAHEGTDFDILSNTATGAVVQIDFEINGESDQIVIGAADDSAVSADDDGDDSMRGSFDLSDRLEAGFSDGPDLEQAIPNASANRMTYCFDTDETLDASQTNPSQFKINHQDGVDQADISNIYGDVDLGTGPANCVTIGFTDDGPDAVANAVAAGVGAHRGVPGFNCCLDKAATDLLPSADNDNHFESGTGFVDDGSNEEIAGAHVGVGGAPPTGAPAPPAPPGPTPPGPTPPGVPTVRTGLCDPNRATAPLAELLIGSGGPDLICGFGGDDTLRGLGGADTLKGQQGDDTHAGAKGKDNARGGPGNDSLRGGRGADTLKGGGGRDTARGGKGTDLCRAETEKGCEN